MDTTISNHRSDLGIVQALFDTTPAIKALGHRIVVAGFIEAVRDIRQLCANPSTPCSLIRNAWQKLAYELGDSMVVCLLRDLDSWLWIPWANMDGAHRYRPHDDYTAVWVNNGEVVVGRSVRVNGQVRVRFDVENVAKP